MREKELNWISLHFDELERYAGKWVAILDEKVIASGDTVKEVMIAVQKSGVRESPLVTIVPTKDEEMYILWRNIYDFVDLLYFLWLKNYI